MKANLHALPMVAVMLAGCAALPDPAHGVTDLRGNLQGDRTRTYMDIVQATAQREGTNFAFSIKTASRVPNPREFSGGKRVDFIWFVDVDRNRTTGQSAAGNDYNLHLYIDETGWHTAVAPVSEMAKALNKTPRPQDCRFRIDGTVITLLVPQRAFPDAYFDWWAKSMTDNAQHWPPLTENPVTRRTSTH